MRAEKRTNWKGKSFILFSYEVIDEMDNSQIITSLSKFKSGDRVEVWFSDKYDFPVMKLHEPKNDTKKTL